MAETKKKKKKVNKKRLISGIFLIAAFLVGAAVFSYPVVSNAWNNYRNSKLIVEYDEAVAGLSTADYEAIWAEAKAYNDQHTVNVIVDAFNEEEHYVLTHPYDTLLNPNGDEVMGYITIPKIDVRLPIYHGVGADVLEHGAGHVEGTSLPIGGESTHAVISAHRGLPSALLFTNLDQLEIGDQFYLKILDQTLAYEVDAINTVLPSETELLAIEPGEDLVTLITCTPYGVNSHRLLVRGHRVPYVEEEAAGALTDTLGNKSLAQILFYIGLAVVLIVLLILWLLSRRRKKKEEEAKKQAEGAAGAAEYTNTTAAEAERNDPNEK